MAKQLELSPRLRLLAQWVPQGARLADVGTDHAYLPVWLDIQDRVSSAIASDLRPGPLARARETGRIHGARRVEYRLCDGLAAIQPEETDTIVIAGMGGENIAAILAAAPWTKDGAHTLLLQPHDPGGRAAGVLIRPWLPRFAGGAGRGPGDDLSGAVCYGGKRRTVFGTAVGRGQAAAGPVGGPIPDSKDYPPPGRRGRAEPLQ